MNDIIQNNNWKVITYTKLKQLNNKSFDEVMKNNLGFTLLAKDNKHYIIYDDSKSIKSQRFTISHEIGHIVLNHFESLNQNREQAANMFAARILMPMCILLECNVKSSKEIEALCDVSSVSAKYRFKRLKILRKRNKFYTDKNEKLLKESFIPFIAEYNNKKFD